MGRFTVGVRKPSELALGEFIFHHELVLGWAHRVVNVFVISAKCRQRIGIGTCFWKSHSHLLMPPREPCMCEVMKSL